MTENFRGVKETCFADFPIQPGSVDHGQGDTHAQDAAEHGQGGELNERDLSLVVYVSAARSRCKLHVKSHETKLM